MIKNYYLKAKTFAVYPSDNSNIYLTLGLIGESGEVADKLKKVIRDERCDINKPETWSNDARTHIMLELGDVAWYAVVLAGELIERKSNSEDEKIYAWNNIEKAYTYNFKNAIVDEPTSIDKLAIMGIMNCSLRISKEVFSRNYRFLHTINIISKLLCAISTISCYIGFNMRTTLSENINKLSSRLNRDMIHGSGDDR